MRVRHLYQLSAVLLIAYTTSAFAGAPPNDLFANAINVPFAPGLSTVTGNNTNATLQGGEPSITGNGGGKSVWWNWTPTSDGIAVIDTFGSGIDSLLGVYTGSAVNALTLVDENDDSFDDDFFFQSQVFIAVNNGVTYRIAVDGYDGEFGPITLNINFLSPPANDNFANSTLIPAGTGTVSGTNILATAEANDPDMESTFSAGSGGGAETVWWHWVADITGNVEFSLNGSDFDTVIGVFTGSSLATLVEEGINDDFYGLQSSIIVSVTTGTTYRICVAGWTDPMHDPGDTGGITLSVVAPLVNDDFPGTSLASGDSTTNASNVGATLQGGEPTPFSPGTTTVWWNWTAPSDGALDINTFGSSFDTILGVYTGSAVNALTEIVSGDDSGFNFQSIVSLPVLGGVIYNIQVNGYGSASGAITLNVDFTAAPPRPANDDFADSIALPGGSTTTTGNNIGATPETGEPSESEGTSVWWNWTAPITTLVEANTFGSSFDTILGIYTGSAPNALTEIAYNDDDAGGLTLQSRLSFNAVAGTLYQIQVNGFSGAEGDITLNIIEAQPPVNDDFVNRIDLGTASTATTGTNFFATAEAGEHSVNDEGGTSVWWDWTAPVDGDLVIDTLGSDFDVMLAVYVSPGFPGAGDLVDEADFGFSESLAFAVTAGTTYHIQVDGYQLEQGNIELSITFTVPPPNDDYADAINLGSGSTTTTGTNVNATAEAGELSVGGNGGVSVWWTWTAAQNGAVDVNTFGSDFDTMIVVYSGTTYTLADVVVFNDEVGTEAVSFTGLAGTTYHIQIDGFAQDQGNVALQIVFTPPPANDDFANAFVLSGGNLSSTGTNLGATPEAGEPFIASPFGGGSGDKSVWWVWTAPATPGHAIEINTFGSDFDTMLGIYTGSGVSALLEVGSNDDDAVNAPQSSVSFNAVGGTTYYILVNGYDNGSGAADGNITLNIVFNQDPVANAQSISTDEDVTFSGTLSGSDADNDALTYTVETNGTLGTVTIIDDVAGTFDYVPNPNASGTDSFTFRVYDGVSTSSPVTVTATVLGVADAPLVSVGDANGPEGSAVALPISVMLDDNDGSESLTIVVSDILPGITLNHGTEGPAGTWTLTAADLAGLAANIPDNVDFFATVTATATESSNGDAEVATTPMHIAAFNVEPTIALSGTQSANGGYAPYILTFGAITDPGTDTVTEYIVHWGDGNTETFSSPFPTSVSHSYAAVTGSPVIVVDLVDEDGLHLACGTLQAPDFSATVILAEGRVGDSFFFDFIAGAGLVGTPTPVITVEYVELPAPLTVIGDVGLSISGTTLVSGALLKAGELTVTFRATNSGGTKLVTLVIKIKHTSGGSNTPQIKSAPTATPNPAQVNISVAFTAVATDADGDLLSYYWNFGDGSDSHENRRLNTTHVYTQPGTYRCTLNVEDDKHLAFQHFTVVVVEAASSSTYKINTFKLTFDFRNPVRSQLVIVGSVPIPAGQPVAGVTANVQIPGSLYSQDFLLNSKFTGGTTTSLFSLKVTAPGATQNIAKFTLHLKSTAGTDLLQPSLFQMLTPLGYTTETIGKPGKPVVLPLVIRCPNTDAGTQNDINTVYTTVKGKTGKAILAK